MTSDRLDVPTQIQTAMAQSRDRHFKGKFIAYFQTETNTYADIDILESWWREIEKHPADIIGLAIGTRPDCLSTDMLSLLSELGKKFMVWLELGLQSALDRTLTLIHRGHDYPCFVNAVYQTQQFQNILTCAHIILGLPGETESDMRFTIRELDRLGLDGVKIHHLQVVKNTVLAEWYSQGNVRVFDETEYIALLTRLLPHLSSKIIVHRLIGDIHSDLLIAPQWRLPKTQIVQLLKNDMQNAGTYQGMAIESRSPSRR